MSTPNSHDAQLPQLIQELENLHSEMLNLANDNLPALLHIHKDHQASAGNLLHYLALRRHDIRKLQERLASMGLSSLGRTEGHALGGLRTVVGVLSRLNQASPGEAAAREQFLRRRFTKVDGIASPEPLTERSNSSGDTCPRFTGA